MQMTQPVYDLSLFSYNKTYKRISVPSEYFGMPPRFKLRSHITGRIVDFVPIAADDPLYDEDGWDGEQAVYRPLQNGTNVEYAIIYNQY